MRRSSSSSDKPRSEWWVGMTRLELPTSGPPGSLGVGPRTVTTEEAFPDPLWVDCWRDAPVPPFRRCAPGPAAEQGVAELAINHRLPTMSNFKDAVEAGGLMSYSPSWDDLYRRGAIYVDKILKGAKPADLSVEQATKFELVINGRTALGLPIPPSLL